MRARPGPDQGRRRRPPGHGLDVLRGRHRLLAQRRRREGRPRARRHDGRGLRAPLRDVARAGLRRSRRASTSPARCAASSTTRPTSRGSEIDLANGAFGQGVAVTPIQLAAAYAAMINGGMLVQPHVVKTIGDRDVDGGRRTRVIESRDLRSSWSASWPTSSTTCPSTRPDARPGLRRRRQDRHGADLGREAQGAGRTTSSTTRSSATSAESTSRTW